MRRYLPSIIAGTLLLTAIIIAMGGIMLAKSDQTVRRLSDRQQLQAYAAALQNELNRLEKDGLIRHLTQIPVPTTRAVYEETLDAARGVSVLSSVTLISTNRSNRSLTIFPHEDRLPRPPNIAMEWPDQELIDDEYLISRRLLNESEIDQGWLPHQNYPNHRFFWRRTGGKILVFSLDYPSIKAIVNEQLRKWIDTRNDFPLTEQSLDSIRDPGGSVIAGADVSHLSNSADFNAPCISPLGHWQVNSWDKVEKITKWNADVLVASGGMALLLCLTAFFVHSAVQRAIHLAERRVSFVNSVSHELRTPLTNMMLNLDLTKDLIEPENPAAKRLNLITQEATRLKRLIDNVLAFASQKAAPSSPSAGVPDELVRQTLEDFTPAMSRQQMNHVFHQGAPHLAYFDSDSFIQILSNLLSNVEKYAPQSELFTITTSQAGEQFTLLLADNGPGISPSQSERIFRAYTRLDNRSTQGVAGTGIGLNIARNLARQLGGDLCLIPTKEGACFQFTMHAPLVGTTDAGPIPFPIRKTS